MSIARRGALLLLLLPLSLQAGEKDEAVYARAVEWLLAKQHDNGGFGQIPGEEPGELGMTGLAVKALAGAPEPHRKKAAAALEKGVGFILGCRQQDGSFVQPRSGLATYRTAIAILALSAVDRQKYAKEIAGAAAWLKEEQLDQGDQLDPSKPHFGGFGYGKGGRGGGGADLSNSHLALAALEQAGIPADDPVFQRAMTFIKRCQNNSETNDAVAGLKPLDDGGFFYDPAPPRDSESMNQDGTHSHASYAGMTYSGLLSLVYCGAAQDDPAVKAALTWVGEHYTLEENSGMGSRGNASGSQGGLYYYYHSFAKCLAALGKPTVETKQGQRRWARELFDALASRQAADGSFANTDPRWWEKDPVLVTTYVLNAMNYARPFLED